MKPINLILFNLLILNICFSQIQEITFTKENCLIYESNGNFLTWVTGEIGNKIYTLNTRNFEQYSSTAECINSLFSKNIKTFTVRYHNNIIQNRYKYDAIYESKVVRYENGQAIYGNVLIDYELITDKKLLNFKKIKFYNWYYKDEDQTTIWLNPDKWQYRIRVTDNVIRDDSQLMQVLKSIVTSKNLPRWEYKTDKIEAYFRIIKESDITAIENLKILKGWTNNDFIIQKFQNLE